MTWRPSISIAAFIVLAASATACTTGDRSNRANSVDGEQVVHVIDLSHKLTTFRPSTDTGNEQRFAADLTNPVGASRPVSAFSEQMLLVRDPDFPTGDGVFRLNTTVLPENIGTSIDAGGHFIPTLRAASRGDQRGLADLTVDDLTGPVVVIDISPRVEAELRKNNGAPGPVELTNFGNASRNVATAADIDAVANEIRDRSFVIVHTGWSRFYLSSGPGLEGPYVNGFNFPGISREAIARLIDIEESRNIRINGIGVDNLTVDVGANAGAPKFGPGSFPAHLQGLPRGWKLLENLANTEKLGAGQCTLFVGAMNHVGGVAGWARIFASCVH